MILKSQSVRILEYLQDNNATANNLETNGKTLSDLAGFGLNKTQAHKHLPELKTQQLIVSKQIATGGRPADNYGITPLGTLKVFKHRLEGKSYDTECDELERIQKYFPSITKYWDDELVEFGDLRYKALFNAIDRLEIRSRGKHYFSMSMALQYETHFLTFEKTYALVTTEKENAPAGNGIVLEVKDTFRDFAESSQTKTRTVTDIEEDIRDFITFQFYYNLMIFPNSTSELIRDLQRGLKKKKISKEDYQRILLQQTKDYRESLGGYFFNDADMMESELKKISEQLLMCIQLIIAKDRTLKRMINEQQKEIQDTTNEVLNYFKNNVE